MKTTSGIFESIIKKSYDHDHYKKWAAKNELNHTDRSAMNQYAREQGLSASEKKRQSTLCALDDHHNCK